MDNVIKVSKQIQEHLATYWVGVLVGMGVSYTIDRESLLYMVLREYRREAYKKRQKEKLSVPRPHIVVSGIDKDSVKASWG